MIYFDSDFLKQYLTQRKKVKVFVDSDVLTITDVDDISNSKTGSGIDAHGNMNMFDYQDIIKIQVGPNIITIDALQSMVGDKEMSSDKATPNPTKKDEPKSNEDDSDDIPKPDMAGFTPSMIGRLLVKEYKEKYGKC